jgi:Ni/Co efflux regulator RcnB
MVAGAVALTAVGSAMADPPRRGHYDNDRYERRDDRRDYRRDDRRDDRRWDDRRDNRRHWNRGDRFDRHNTRYVVVRDNDYRRYRLAPPRRGEYYARTDTGDILLVAAATGLIIWALNN